MRNILLAPMWSAVSDPDLNALLHPASAFDHPREVVNDPDLTTEEKRAILSSWASDACSVESQPAMRSRRAPSIRSALTRSWMRFAASIADRSRNGSACFGANVPAATRTRMEASH
jgi:phage gpG-like protein